MQTKGVISLLLKVWSLMTCFRISCHSFLHFPDLSVRKYGRDTYFKQTSQVIFFLCTLISGNCWFTFLCIEDLDTDREDVYSLVFLLFKPPAMQFTSFVKQIFNSWPCYSTLRNTLGFPYRDPFLLPFLSVFRSLRLWVVRFLK